MKRNQEKWTRRLLALVTALFLMVGFAACGETSQEPPDAGNGASESYEDWNVEEHTQFRKQEYLEEHYEKHVIDQAEFEEYGEVSMEDYLRMAQQLVDAPDADVLTKEEEDGDLLYYDPETNGFAVLSSDGYLRTYFRPSDGIEYFERQ